MTGPTCDCGGQLLEVLRFHASTLEGRPGTVHIAFRCSACGRISSATLIDRGQTDLLTLEVN